MRIHQLPIVWLTGLFLFLTSASYAQNLSVNLTGKTIKSSSKNLDNTSAEYYKINIKKSTFKPKSSLTNSSILDLNLNLGEKTFKMQLFNSALMHPVLHDELVEMGITPPLTFEGNTTNGGSVRMTVNDGFIYGYINEDNDSFYLEPAQFSTKSASSDHYVFYKEDLAFANSLNNIHTSTCGSHLLNESKSISENITKSNKGDAKMACRGMNIAIASDFSMRQRYGSDQAVINHNIGVMNIVQGDYDGIGDDPFELELSIVGQYIASSMANNPYASTSSVDIGVLLPEFRTWVLANGFGAGVTPNIGGIVLIH